MGNSSVRPCLVVIVGDSCSEGRGFKSQCRILDGFLLKIQDDHEYGMFNHRR